MDKRYEKLLKCRDYVRTRTDFVPEAALVLGSGLEVAPFSVIV